MQDWYKNVSSRTSKQSAQSPWNIYRQVSAKKIDQIYNKGNLQKNRHWQQTSSEALSEEFKQVASER